MIRHSVKSMKCLIVAFDELGGSKWHTCSDVSISFSRYFFRRQSIEKASPCGFARNQGGFLCGCACCITSTVSDSTYTGYLSTFRDRTSTCNLLTFILLFLI